ncbi:MAG: ergothioneine biosynthesis protein EgtB [Myxococcales bacterium]|nr:ergothioneine biosynthesis protein EgtB [Myxococcales bacterium]
MSSERPRGARATLIEAYQRVRATTERLVAPLSAEDQLLQSMPSCSPTKWHRAHTTWFFETFVLAPRGVAPVDDRWGVLFNSYYVAVGPRHARPKRGLLSRPTVEQIADYRRIVDARMLDLLASLDDAALAALRPTIELGLAHEQQHQELLLTDILNALSESPLKPAYRDRPAALAVQAASAASASARFVPSDGGLREIGAAPSSAFRFDNEEPRHRVFLEPFALADRLVTVGDWKAFADAGGYDEPSLWLSEGFDWVRANGVRAPLYAHRDAGALVVFGLDGVREADDSEPLTHVSYYEADALARFLDARLPTEAEWEIAAATTRDEGNFLEADALRALPALPATDATQGTGVRQLFGDAWEWTSSAYTPYPGFQAAAGAIGEYNGKFMVNQLVLRGGSCFTPRGHVRATYRNFWHPDTRFQVAGLRLARWHRG